MAVLIIHLYNHQILCAIAGTLEFCCLELWFQEVKNVLNFKLADNSISITGLHLKNPRPFPTGWRAQCTIPQSHGSPWAEQKVLPRPLTCRALGLAGVGLAGTGSNAGSPELRVREEREAEGPVDVVGPGQAHRGAASPLAEVEGLFPGTGYFLALPSILPYLWKMHIFYKLTGRRAVTLQPKAIAVFRGV